MFAKINSTNKQLKKHDKYLRENIFFTKIKWPHFDLLFQDIKKLSKNTPNESRVLFIERTNLYGKLSLFAPYFNKQLVASIDCSERFIKSRGSYNKSLINVNEIIPFYSADQKSYLEIKEKKYKADLIIIPNLIHHVPYHMPFFRNMKSILNKNGKIYVFEPLVRELHQAPDDYLRFTPFGLEIIFKDLGYKNINYTQEGGPFSVISYCYDQALQYLPKKVLDSEKKFFLNKLLPKLNKYEKKYKSNLKRSHSSFPMSYSIIAKK